MTLPSKKRLTELFKYYERQRGGRGGLGKDDPIYSEDLATVVRVQMEKSNSHKNVDEVLDLTNKLLPGHGVEAIRGNYQVDRYYYDIVALYVNMGDPYIPTLLYDTDRGKFYVTGYGDWVEKNEKRYGIY